MFCLSRSRLLGTRASSPSESEKHLLCYSSTAQLPRYERWYEKLNRSIGLVNSTSMLPSLNKAFSLYRNESYCITIQNMVWGILLLFYLSFLFNQRLLFFDGKRRSVHEGTSIGYHNLFTGKEFGKRVFLEEQHETQHS
ncbi:hypothetical protein FKM82_021603 [Ascaphus truei]